MCNYHYFLFIIYMYKKDNLTIIAITITMAVSYILMTRVSVILSAKNTNEEIFQKVQAYSQLIFYAHGSLN